MKKEKKESLLSTIIAVVIVAAIVIGVIYAINKAQDPTSNIPVKEYNGFEFKQDQNGFWHVTLATIRGDSDIPFRLHPTDVDMLSYDPRINVRLGEVQRNGGRVVIAYDASLADPNLQDVGAPAIAAVEIAKITSQVFGMETESAFTSEVPGAENLTIFDCKQSSPSVFVFEFRLGEENTSSRVFSENYCAVIRANQLNDTIKLADLTVYKLTGIIPPNQN